MKKKLMLCGLSFMLLVSIIACNKSNATVTQSLKNTKVISLENTKDFLCKDFKFKERAIKDGKLYVGKYARDESFLLRLYGNENDQLTDVMCYAHVGKNVGLEHESKERKNLEIIFKNMLISLTSIYPKLNDSNQMMKNCLNEVYTKKISDKQDIKGLTLTFEYSEDFNLISITARNTEK